MTFRRPRLTAPLTVAALVLSAGSFLAAASLAEAQCLPQSDCDALKQQLRDSRQDFKASKKEIRDLVQQAQALPRGSAERQALKDQIRALRRAAKAQRKEARPLRESYRSGCRNC